MQPQDQRNLAILSAIDEGDALTQRALAERLGVAVGLTNLYLKRLARKGYIKVTEFPRKPLARKRLRYLLTPKGLSEKTRLTYAYLGRSLALYREARETLREALAPLAGRERVALYGSGEAAELAYLTLREAGIEPVGVFDREPGGRFLGMTVRDWRELGREDVDRVVVASFDRPKNHVPALVALGVPPEKLLLIAPPGKSHGAR